MKLFNVIAASVAVAMATGVASADINSQIASLQAQVNQIQAQVSNKSTSSVGNMVGVNSNLSWSMMSNTAGVGKEVTLLQARQNGLNTPVTLGGYVQADANYQHTNQAGEFVNADATSFSSTTTSASKLDLTNIDLAATAAIGSWVTGYVQLGQSYVGQSTLNSATTLGVSTNNTNLSVQDAYLVLGNLAQNPVYGFVGLKDIDFGSFASVDMYAQPLNRVFFAAQGNTAGIGLNAAGFNGTISAINGGSQTSLVNATNLVLLQNTNTSSSKNVNNFAINMSYGAQTGAVNWSLGAGYLNGSNTLFTTTTNSTNGAWDVNGKLSVAGFDLLAEYDLTANTTQVPTILGTSNTAQRVTAWSLGADYNFPVFGFNSKVDAEYSTISLSSGTNNALQQFALGYNIQPVNNVWTGLEYLYNKVGSNINNAVNSNNNSLTNSTVLLNVSAAF